MLIYLLKSGACLAIFMAFYRFFLEKENMHVFKRYYLLGALVIAFGIPLVTFTQYIEVTPMPIVNAPVTSVVHYTEAVPTAQETNYLPIILWSIYGVGILLFGAKFLMNLFHIVLKIKRNPQKRSDSFVHVLLTDLITPHTFFKYIFLNKQKFDQHEIPQEVFWHEETHAKQKHSIDVLFIELLQVIFWFNPLIYLVKYAIKMNHEFLADHAVLNRGISASHYQHILLAFSSDAAESPLANAINYSSTRHALGVIKKRFKVMKTHTSKRNIWLRSTLLLPLLALTLYGFSEKKEVLKPLSDQTLNSETIQDVVIYIDESNAVTLNGNSVEFEDLEIEINKLNPNLSNQQKQVFLSATIQYESDKSIPLTKRIHSILSKANVFRSGSSNVNTLKRLGLPIKPSNNKYIGKTLEEANAIFEDETIDLSTPKPIDPNSPWQIGFGVSEITYEETDEEPVIVTSEMIEQYNSIAKSINSQPEATRTAKLKDFNRLAEIYSYMSEEQTQLAEPLPQYPNLQGIEIVQQEPIYTVLINYKGNYLVNDELGTLKTIEHDFKAIAADKNKSKTIAFKNERDTPQAAIDQFMDLVKKHQLKTVEYNLELHASTWTVQIKATPAEMAEYNKLAKNINSQSPEKRVIRMQDMRRLGELHDKMTEEQKANAEPMPNFPPPPPPLTKDGTRNAAFINKTTSPPPPPIPPNASEEQKIGYEKAMNDYKVQRESYTYKHTNDKGEVVNVTVIPEKDDLIPPPPPPISPVEHIKEMSKKGALFYYNNKTISADEALTYVKSQKDLSISIKQLDKDRPKVYISTEPIKVENKNNSKELVMINGKKTVNRSITMTRAELMDATLSIKEGSIISFKLKIPGKPTQSITGNKMNTETKALIKEALDKDAIQIFMIKNSNNEAHPPIKILIKE